MNPCPDALSAVPCAFGNLEKGRGEALHVSADGAAITQEHLFFHVREKAYAAGVLIGRACCDA